MSLCIDDLVPDHCSAGFGIPLDSAHITDFPGSRCYTWRCTDYPSPVPAAYCREDKATGAIACATRESGGEYTCPAKVDGDVMVHAYDPDADGDHFLRGFRANGVSDEPCGPSVEPPNPQPSPVSPSPVSSSTVSPLPVHPAHRHHAHHWHHGHHPHHPSPESTKRTPQASSSHEHGRPAPTLSCIDCTPTGKGWSCGSCK